MRAHHAAFGISASDVDSLRLRAEYANPDGILFFFIDTETTEIYTLSLHDALPIYHASAVFASNYFVVVEAVAQRLLRHAGLTDADAWQALRPLVEGTLENLTRGEPGRALTGPVARGDVDTIRRHLESLTPDDAILYRALGRAALELAGRRGMDEATAARVADALATDPRLVLQPGAQS